MKKSVLENSTANEREVTNSRKNIVTIEQTISRATETMRELNEALNGTYSESDRRFEKYDEALTAFNDALFALEALRDFERETIALCTEKPQQ